MACRVAMAALEVLREEGMADNACVMGQRLRAGLRSLDAPGVELVRGRGLLNAVVIKVGRRERLGGGQGSRQAGRQARRERGKDGQRLGFCCRGGGLAAVIFWKVTT